MKAYIIVDVTITNPSMYEDYKKLTPASLVPFDGKFVARGGAIRNVRRRLATRKNCDFGISLQTKGKGLVVIGRLCSGQGDSTSGIKNKNDFSGGSGISTHSFFSGF